MEKIKKLLVGAFFLLIAGTTVRAQGYLENENYGATPEERQQNALTLNFFRDNYENQNYEEAIKYLAILLEKAPKATQNIYVRGANLYKDKITNAQSLAEKNLYIDSLMYLYDIRNENFGDDEQYGSPYILRTKADDYYSYRPTDFDNILLFYNDAIKATPDPDSELLTAYYYIVVEAYRNDIIETDELFQDYERLMAIYESQNTEDSEEGIKKLEALLISSGAADCNNLEKIFRPQWEADPQNVDLMNKILGMMSRRRCGSDFQLEVAENLYKVQPTPETCIMLAQTFEGKEDFEKSLYYWQQAISGETDPEKKESYMVRAATSALGNKNNSQAASFARQALQLKPEDGLAYYILSQAYAAGVSNACGDFERQAAYWIVVDHLQRARSMVTDQAQLENLNRQIGSFSAGFPDNEELFFRSLTPGQSYQVNCGWISGRTIIRSK